MVFFCLFFVIFTNSQESMRAKKSCIISGLISACVYFGATKSVDTSNLYGCMLLSNAMQAEGRVFPQPLICALTASASYLLEKRRPVNQSSKRRGALTSPATLFDPLSSVSSTRQPPVASHYSDLRPHPWGEKAADSRPGCDTEVWTNS